MECIILSIESEGKTEWSTQYSMEAVGFLKFSLCLSFCDIAIFSHVLHVYIYTFSPSDVLTNISDGDIQVRKQFVSSNTKIMSFIISNVRESNELDIYVPCIFKNHSKL